MREGRNLLGKNGRTNIDRNEIHLVHQAKHFEFVRVRLERLYTHGKVLPRPKKKKTIHMDKYCHAHTIDACVCVCVTMCAYMYIDVSAGVKVDAH